MTATLEIDLAGIKNQARVIVENKSVSLDEILRAAMQSDRELAADYAAILSQIAPNLALVIERQYDGESFAGCHWWAARLATNDGRFEPLTELHQFGSSEWKGASGDEGKETARKQIYAGAIKAGLGSVNVWRTDAKTVSEAHAKMTA
jgi:hypothetical protein